MLSMLSILEENRNFYLSLSMVLQMDNAEDNKLHFTAEVNFYCLSPRFAKES